MRIAILGETSVIAQDMVERFKSGYDLYLYNRNNVQEFSKHDYDVVINFVGCGSPRKAVVMGADILRVTEEYDGMALKYLDAHPQTKYVFLSSGAAYGSDFNTPVNEDSVACIPLNAKNINWYSVAKIMAECRHRARPQSIVDIRVFNYFSPRQSLDAGFMMTSMIDCILNTKKFYMARSPMVRDWISPEDLSQLMEIIIHTPDINMAVDCYSSKPLSSIALAQIMSTRFGLEWEYANLPIGKRNYFSTNYAAGELGYTPTKSSLETIVETSKIFLNSSVSTVGRAA